jgi:predicted small metal-binding protein
MEYAFQCSNLIADCDERLDGESRDEVAEKARNHMREFHGMVELPSELTQWVLGTARPE